MITDLYYIAAGGNDVIIARQGEHYAYIGEQDFYKDFKRQGIDYQKEPGKALQAINDIETWQPISKDEAMKALSSGHVTAINKAL